MSDQPLRSPDASTGWCPTCGRALDSHDRHLRFALPEPVLAVPESERAERTWQTEGLMQVQGVGSFIRVLLPVRLIGGYQLTFGLWLCVSDEDLQRAFQEWWAPTYPDLVLDGTIANEVPPWGLFTRPARAVVRDLNQVPYLDSSEDPGLTGVLREEWPHEAVIDALPAHLR